MSDLISKASALEIINNRIENREHMEDSVWTRNDEAIDIQFAIEDLPVYREMNCIKDGKYTGDSCFGCSIKIKDCEIRDKVYRSRWIPASERLPEIRLHKGEPIEFITMVKGEQAPRTLYIDREDSWRHVDSYYDPYDDYKYNVIAWQPLPEPYKEDKND